MQIRWQPRSKCNVLVLIAGVVLIWLWNSADPIQAQDLNWTPVSGVVSGVVSGDEPNNWFVPENWTPITSSAPHIPTATESASVDTTTPEPAIIGPNAPGTAVAEELLIGGILTSGGTGGGGEGPGVPGGDTSDPVGGIGGVGGVVISPAGPGAIGEVIINGPNASLVLGQNKPPVSLDVIQGSLVVENGGTLTTFGSGVGRIAGATAPGLVTVTGPGSSWIENGTLIIGSQSSGQVTIADGASFQGAQTVIVGTLGQIAIGTGGLAGTFNAPAIANNGVINFNFTDTTTLSAQVSGSGQIVKLGSGTLILTGNNTYSGGTTISAGTLQLGNGGTTGNIAGNVLDNGVLAFNRNDSFTFGAMINGTGSVTQIGTGTTILTGSNTYTGTTTINAGSLIVDGSIASQQTIVNAGGFLGGHGTIGGNLSNSGIVGPGDSPGTLTVANNYIQNANGTLRIQVGGLGANQHDLLAVNGHVTLGGTLQLVRLGKFNLQPGNQIVFLTAQNGISGAFNTVQNDFTTGTIVRGVVITSADTVVLEGQLGSFTNIPGVTLTQNQYAVGKMLNSAVGNPAAAPLFAFLNSQPVANLPNDYNLIAPTQISSINATAVSVGKVQATNLGGRMANIRGGSTGFSSAGFGISGGAASFGEGFAGVSGPEGKSGPPAFAPTPGNRWGVFLTGLGEFTNVDSTPNAPGYDVNTGGFTLGVDYRLTPNFALGLSAGYAHTGVSVDSPGGNIDVNAGTIGMYATVFGNGFYLDAAVNGGPSGYTTHRTGLQGSANGSTNGGDLNALVAGGYDWTKGNLTIEPTASFQYGYVALDGFTETGSLAPLKFPRQNTESERTAVGAKVSYEWKTGNITAIPQFSAAWQHEFGSTAYSVVANLASGAGNSFTVFGPQIGRDSLLIGAGATVILNDRVSAYLYYDGEFARTNYLSNNVTGGVRITF